MKLGTLKRKLDAKIQANRTETTCLICGAPASVLHHYVQKRQCEALRYEPRNHIPLCGSCHYKLHTKDASLSGRIAIIKGKRWEAWIQEKRKELVKQDKAYQQKLEKLLKEASP